MNDQLLMIQCSRGKVQRCPVCCRPRHCLTVWTSSSLAYASCSILLFPNTSVQVPDRPLVPVKLAGHLTGCSAPRAYHRVTTSSESSKRAMKSAAGICLIVISSQPWCSCLFSEPRRLNGCASLAFLHTAGSSGCGVSLAESVHCPYLSVGATAVPDERQTSRWPQGG